jgi:ABC-type transport system involved in multi-copper enzyme maturation permease subunit
MLAILLGFVFVVAGALGMFIWKGDFVIVLKGLLPFLLLVGGVISVVAGITSISESFPPKAETEDETQEKK